MKLDWFDYVRLVAKALNVAVERLGPEVETEVWQKL
jgi:hypothetical protein